HLYGRPGEGGRDRGDSGERGRAGASGDGTACGQWRAAAFGAIEANDSDGKSGKARGDCRGNRLVAVLRRFLCYGDSAGGGRREIIISTAILSAAEDFRSANEAREFLRGLCGGGFVQWIYETQPRLQEP